MAKRLNTPFVSVIGAIALVGFGAVLFGPRLKKITTKPVPVLIKEQRDIAKQMVAAGQYQGALDAITYAWLMDRSNKEVCVERGDILTLLVDEEGNMRMDQARVSWQNALDIDPRYVTALTRLLDSFVGQMEVAPTPQVCIHMRDFAKRLGEIDPSNTRARAYMYIATIQELVTGVSKTPEEVQTALDELEKIFAADNTQAEVLFYIIRGKARIASEAFSGARPDVGRTKLLECRTMLDEATRAHPKNPDLNFRAFQGYVMVADADRDDADRERDKAAATDVLKRARENIKDEDSRYADFQYVASDWARRNGHPEESEKILREFYNTHQSDQRARLALARILAMTGDTAKRDEAIDILSLPVRKSKVTTSYAATNQPSLRELESQTQLDLASLRVSKYPSLPAAEKPAMMAKIDEAYRKLDIETTADSVAVLRLKGLVEQLKGKNVDAVDSLSKAMVVLEHTDPSNPIKWDLMYQLATVNRLAGQNHSAEVLLARIVENFKDYVPARMQLADVYLEENNVVEAKKHIDILAALQPNSQDVLRLQVGLAQRNDIATDVETLYSRLVESKFEERLIKAQVAATLRKFSETIRLLNLMQDEKPDQSAITVAIFEAYAKSGDRPKAQQILTDALKRRPKDARLLLLQEQFNNSTWEEPDLLLEELLEVVGDPLSHEVQAGRRALREQNFAEAIDHAGKADKIRPDDPTTWDLYFQIYKQQQNWDLGDRAMRKLEMLNADHAQGRMYRWTLAMARGRYAEAIAVGRELTQFRENFGQSWVLLAESYQANGQYLEALKHYEAALARQTTNIDAYKGKAICYENLSQPDQALEAIQQGRRLFPENVMLREWEYNYMLKSDPETVIPKRQKLLDQNPNDPENYVALAAAYFRSAQKIFAKDPVQASKHMSNSLTTLTHGVGKYPDDIRLNRELALAMRTNNQFEAGAKLLRDLSKMPRWKDKPDPLIALSDYYAGVRRFDDARQALIDAWAVTKNQSIEVELRLANFYQQQKQYDKALELLEANADDPRIALQTLQIHSAAGHRQQALDGLEKALARQPNNTDLLNLKGVVLIDMYNYPDARKALVRSLQIEPRNDVAMYLQAMVEMRDPISCDLALVQKNMSQVVVRNPRNTIYHLLYYEYLMRTRDLTAAAAELESALRYDALNRELRVKLLNLLSRMGNWELFEQIVTYAEQNPAVGDPAIWQRTHAYGLAAQKKFPEALEKIRLSISLDPNNEMYARDYLVILLESRQLEQVIVETDKLLNAGHTNWWVYHVRGIARALGGKPDLAREQFDKAIKMADGDGKNPDNDALDQIFESIAEMSIDDALKALAPKMDNDKWRLVAVAYQMRRQEWQGALDMMMPMVQRRASLPRDQRLSVIRFAAECYQASDQLDKAARFYSEWLSEAPYDPACLNNYAALLSEQNNFEKARTYSQQAYDNARKWNNVDPYIIDTHAWVLIHSTGLDVDNGIDALEKLLKSHESFIEAHYHLGVAYSMRRRNEDARLQLEKAMNLISDMENVNKRKVDAKLKSDVQAAFAEAMRLRTVGK